MLPERWQLAIAESHGDEVRTADEDPNEEGRIDQRGDP
jgi:hypothetical protein